MDWVCSATERERFRFSLAPTLSVIALTAHKLVRGNLFTLD